LRPARSGVPGRARRSTENLFRRRRAHPYRFGIDRNEPKEQAGVEVTRFATYVFFREELVRQQAIHLRREDKRVHDVVFAGVGKTMQSC
jgi:hypothetical protein